MCGKFVCVCVYFFPVLRQTGAWGSRRRTPVHRRHSPPQNPPFSGWCEQGANGVFLYSLAHAQGCSDTSSVAGRAVGGRRGGLMVPPAAPPRPSSTSERNIWTVPPDMRPVRQLRRGDERRAGLWQGGRWPADSRGKSILFWKFLPAGRGREGGRRGDRGSWELYMW